MSSHEIPSTNVAIKERPLALHVCTSKPMIPNEYHTKAMTAATFIKIFFITTCKDKNYTVFHKELYYINIFYITLNDDCFEDFHSVSHASNHKKSTKQMRNTDIK
jgi:hypothetical protein